MPTRKVSMKAIEGAIKSANTPAPLKKGLIKKYGKRLGLTQADIKKYTKATKAAKKVARKVKAKKNPEYSRGKKINQRTRKGRIQHAIIRLKAGGPWDREFDWNFETGDGNKVMAGILEVAKSDSKLRDAMIKHGIGREAAMALQTNPKKVKAKKNPKRSPFTAKFLKGVSGIKQTGGEYFKAVKKKTTKSNPAKRSGKSNKKKVRKKSNPYVQLSDVIKAKDFDNVLVSKGTHDSILGGAPEVLYLNIEPYTKEITERVWNSTFKEIEKNKAAIFKQFSKVFIVVDDRFIIYKKAPPRDFKKGGRVKNPPRSSGTVIYDRITAIEATKGKNSLWPKEDFRHDFKVGGKILGLPNGDLLVKKGKDKKPLWKNFDYDESDGTRKNPESSLSRALSKAATKGKKKRMWSLTALKKVVDEGGIVLPKVKAAVRFLLHIAHGRKMISASEKNVRILVDALKHHRDYMGWDLRVQRQSASKALQLISDSMASSKRKTKRNPSTKRPKHYVGIKRNKATVCSLKNPPTKASHGKRYTRMVGPFSSLLKAKAYAAKAAK